MNYSTREMAAKMRLSVRTVQRRCKRLGLRPPYTEHALDMLGFRMVVQEEQPMPSENAQ